MGHSASIQPTKDSKELNYSNANLTSFPMDILKSKECQNVILAFNQLSSLPNLLELSRLTILDISNNHLTKLPFLPDSLIEFNVSNNRLFYEPLSLQLGKLMHLKTLNLSMNQLEELPNDLNQLKGLKELQLHGNHFKWIPECLYELTALQILKLGSNKIEVLDTRIGELTQLHVYSCILMMIYLYMILGT